MYSIQELSEAAGGKLFDRLHVDSWTAKHLLTDSRNVSDPTNSVFVALKGERQNGHTFIPALFEQGLRRFVVSSMDPEFEDLQADFILVENTLSALQKIATQHRKKFNLAVIGITGSNGKTIVKEWLFQLLSPFRKIVRSPKSYNSQIGVPLSVWQIAKEHELGIFEAGISFPNEMEKLQPIILPTIGIFTNVGQAHNENFESEEQKIREKIKLFSSCELLIYCKDYSSLASQIPLKNEAIKYFSWSRKLRADLVISKVVKYEKETLIQAIYKNDFIKITIPFTDEASIENAIHCWCTMLCLDFAQDKIEERMEGLSPVAMRLELKEGINHCSIINDSYNSDLGSLSIALDFLNQQKQHSKRTLILSDILQSGKNEESLYREVAALVAGKGINRILGIGPAISMWKDLFLCDKLFFQSTEEFLRELPKLHFQDETILLKGARAFGFENISRELQQKSHQTVLEINLSALIYNLNFFRSRLQPKTKIMAMVKAFSYGSGGFEIANILQFHRVDYLTVAYVDEGVELRKAGITLPIMVMNAEEQGFDAMLAHRLEPEIYSFRVLTQFAEAAKRYCTLHGIFSVPIHLEINTGMHRLGFEEKEIPELIVRIKNYKILKVVSVFSHLAASDEQEHDAFTHIQAAQFEGILKSVRGGLDPSIMGHLLNSSGILRFSEYQFDMVRLGIGLYGVASTSNEQKQLQNVGTLKTVISQIRHVAAQETIGYSRAGKVKQDKIIATVAIGYADGVSRKLGNGAGKMLVNGKFVPSIGNICMDMTMLDITDVPSKEGDEVIVFGAAYPVHQYAKDATESPYEVLTGVSQRVKRVYFQE